MSSERNEMAWRGWKRSICVACVVACFWSLSAIAAGSFQAEDQWEKTHTTRSIFVGKPVIVVSASQRDHQASMKKWVDALTPRLGDSARLIAVVDLDALPFFVPKSAVRSGLRDLKMKTPVLCDWDGETFDALGLRGGDDLEIVTFDASGKILRRVRANGPSRVKLDAVLSSLP